MAPFPGFDDDIDSVEMLQQILDPIATTSHAHIKYWFRGQSDESWAAEPGIFRKGGVDWTAEKHLTQDFRVIGASLLPETGNDADTYFIQQHYGMPTRLLDWSHSPLAALYFATSDIYKDAIDGRIFFMDAYECQARSGSSRILQISSTRLSPARSVEFHGIATSRHPVFRAAIRPIFEWDDDATAMPDFIVPVRPDHFGGRVNFQHSCFTFHGDAQRSLTINDNPKLKTYRIPSSEKPKIRRQLSMLHINEFSIYGDLTSLAKHLRRSYNVP